MNKDEIIRGVLSNCLLCNKKYNLLNKQHICKRCFRSVCSDCTEEKQLIFQKKQQKRKPHRLCLKCKPEVSFLENYRKHYKLTFNTNSQVGRQWGEKLLKQSLSHPPQYQKPKKQPLRQRNDLWNSFTFSYRSFVGNLVLDVDYYTPLRIIYEKCSYSNCSQYAILFFLCHCDQQLSLELTNALMSTIEQDPPSKQAVYQNLEFLGCTSAEIASLKYYIQFRFNAFMKDLSLNHLTIQVSLFVISGLMSERTPKSPLEKCFSIYIFVIKDIILKYGIDFQRIQLQSLQTLKSQQFQTNMRVLLHKQKLQRQTQKLKNQSSTLRQSLSQHMKMSIERNNSMLSDSDVNIFRKSSDVIQNSQQMWNLKSQNQQLKGMLLSKEDTQVRNKNSKVEEGDLGIMYERLEELSKGMIEDMEQIQKLNKQFIQCLNL